MQEPIKACQKCGHDTLIVDAIEHVKAVVRFNADGDHEMIECRDGESIDWEDNAAVECEKCGWTGNLLEVNQ